MANFAASAPPMMGTFQPGTAATVTSIVELSLAARWAKLLLEILNFRDSSCIFVVMTVWFDEIFSIFAEICVIWTCSVNRIPYVSFQPNPLAVKIGWNSKEQSVFQITSTPNGWPKSKFSTCLKNNNIWNLMFMMLTVQVVIWMITISLAPVQWHWDK